MRLIDADDFDTKLFNDGFFGGLAAAIGNTPRKRKFTIGEFRGMLKNAPTIDAVPVVRCAQCKHLNIVNDPKLYAHCPKTNTVFLPFDLDTRTHFCSLGQRKDEAKMDGEG